VTENPWYRRESLSKKSFGNCRVQPKGGLGSINFFRTFGTLAGKPIERANTYSHLSRDFLPAEAMGAQSGLYAVHENHPTSWRHGVECPQQVRNAFGRSGPGKALTPCGQNRQMPLLPCQSVSGIMASVTFTDENLQVRNRATFIALVLVVPAQVKHIFGSGEIRSRFQPGRLLSIVVRPTGARPLRVENGCGFWP
jgi:hypothetical protein